MPLIVFIAYFAGCALVEAGLNRLTARAWLRSTQLHWAERARLLYPVVHGARLNIVWLAISVAVAQLLFPPHLRLHWILAAVAGWAGATLGAYLLDRRIYPQLGFRRWVYQVLMSWGMQIPFLVVLSLLAWTMPGVWGWGVAARVGGFLLFAVWWSTIGFRQALQVLRAIRPADGQLRSIVDHRSRQLGVVVRRVWILESTMANAFALVAVRELVFTDRILECLQDEELAAVCDHELGHLSESRAVLVGRLAGLAWLVPLLLIRPTIASGSSLAMSLSIIGAAALVAGARRLASKMEKRADSIAASAQLDSGVYARALLKLYQCNQCPAVMPGGFKLHPHLYDRLIAAGLTPDFPRPKAPDEIPWTTGLVLLTLIGLGITVVLSL